MTVTVFTKPHCPQCDATKRQLTKLGVPFETVDLTQNPSTLEQLQAAGFQQAPVVITPDNSWTGYRPDLIREVAQQVAADNRAAATVSASEGKTIAHWSTSRRPPKTPHGSWPDAVCRTKASTSTASRCGPPTRR